MTLSLSTLVHFAMVTTLLPTLVHSQHLMGSDQILSNSSLDTNKTKIEGYRLPGDLRPLHYDLVIEPLMYDKDIANFTFNGSVYLTLTCLNATKQILLHAKDLQVKNPRVMPAAPDTNRSGGSNLYREHTINSTLQLLDIRVDPALQAGQRYVVSVDFSGPLDNKTLSGFYLSSYRNPQGETVYLATTLFEPTDARAAFPCMDEPALKATFRISVVRRSFNRALSNMPVNTSTAQGGERVLDTFQVTPPMCTYLVAFVVCDFLNKTKTTERQVEFSAWTHEDQLNQVDFALDWGVNVTHFLEQYLGQEFPLPKQSMIAIPDIDAAMENWGLITFNENTMLYQEGVSTVDDKEKIATIIAHELAHNWFGNLVSPNWWDDIWLNEGFATFMSALVLDQLLPAWKKYDDMVLSAHTAMGWDAKVTSQPICMPVETLSQAMSSFNDMSYDKGGFVIRMLFSAIGEDQFKTSMKNYLNEFKFRSATHNDLWKVLNDVVNDDLGVNISDVMDTWTLQMNYPVVHVTFDGPNMTLTQERFLDNPDAKDPGKYKSQFQYKWTIPFTYITSSEVNSTKTVWLGRTTNRTSIPISLKAEDWVIGNVNVSGFYRVNYDNQTWHNLIRQLKENHMAINPVNRAQLIDDAWSLARAGITSQEIASSMLEYLHKETEFISWKAAEGHVEYVYTMLSSEDDKILLDSFKEFVANQTSPLYHQFSNQTIGDDLVQSKLKTTMWSLACGSQVPQCLNDSSTFVQTWMQQPDKNHIPVELRNVVYCTAVRHGSTAVQQFLYERLDQETDPSEKSRLLFHLPCCTSNVTTLSGLLERALKTQGMSTQGSMTMIEGVANNPKGTPLAWKFVQKHWDIIANRSADGLLRTFGRLFNTQDTLSQLQALPRLGKAGPHGGPGRMTGLETAADNIRWMRTSYPGLKKWLTQRRQKTGEEEEERREG